MHVFMYLKLILSHVKSMVYDCERMIIYIKDLQKSMHSYGTVVAKKKAQVYLTELLLATIVKSVAIY